MWKLVSKIGKQIMRIEVRLNICDYFAVFFLQYYCVVDESNYLVFT